MHTLHTVYMYVHTYMLCVLLVATGLKDPDARDQCLITLLHSLPLSHFRTVIYLLKHLKW